MFGLNTREVTKLIDTWYERNKLSMQKDIVNKTVSELTGMAAKIVEDNIKPRLDEMTNFISDTRTYCDGIVDKLKELHATAELLRDNPIDKQVASVMGTWLVQLNKQFGAHKDALNKALEHKHDEMVAVVNDLLQQSSLSLDKAERYHMETRALLEKIAATRAPVKKKKVVRKKKQIKKPQDI